jgi:sigma-E factor negative regulatory protein RseB
MMRGLGLALAFCSGICAAQPLPEAARDPLAMLRRVYQATEKLSYTGTFVYQQGDRTETSRITRISGPGEGVERVEVLDGVRREIVRTRDTVRCYLPESRTVKVERRIDRRAFPGMLPEQVSELARHYSITRGEPARIAGYDCEALVLTPRDDLRYGYKLWADVNSGMLLKARIFDHRGETVEQFTFVQLAIGGVPRDRARPRHSVQSWRIDETAVVPADLTGAGWSVQADLPGFRKVAEVTRQLGEARSVGQLVYSDGMAAVSVFIEPMTGRDESVRPGPSSLGAFQIYTRAVANHVVTVVGDTPAASVQRIASRVEYRRPQGQ